MHTQFRITLIVFLMGICSLPLIGLQDQQSFSCDPVTPSESEDAQKATRADDTSTLRWDESDSSVALLAGDVTLWRYHIGRELQKPYFHPVTAGDQVLTWNRPPDHVWHHGLWFSWKYINGVNYWEPNSTTGRPDGRTEWKRPEIEIRDDHSARILMELTYSAAKDGKPVLAEQRLIDVATPTNDGQLTIDWSSRFTALADATLDRTPVVGQSWGGYAGLSVRFAGNLKDRAATGVQGALEFDTSDRYRGRSSAVDYNGMIDGVPVGMAFLDHSTNPRHPTKWYLVRSPAMSYINAALLHDDPIDMQKGETMTLRYRLIAHRDRWNAGRLRAEHDKSTLSLPPLTNP